MILNSIHNELCVGVTGGQRRQRVQGRRDIRFGGHPVDVDGSDR